MRLLKPRILFSALTLLGHGPRHLCLCRGKNWWNPAWTIRKKIDIDTSGKGVAISDPIGTTTVLVRLHEGVFSFMSSKEDGSDLRFTADDHKTVLKHHVEKWDSLLNEAYVWVQVPELKPAAATAIWLYYGNTTEAVAVDPAKETYDENTVLDLSLRAMLRKPARTPPPPAPMQKARRPCRRIAHRRWTARIWTDADQGDPRRRCQNGHPELR
jgi:biopolymer transport protein ExbB